MNVLLLGRKGVVVEEARRRLGLSGVRLYGGSNIDDVRRVFDKAPIDHVVMGAGIDLPARLEIVREIFLRSDTTTVHLKDVASGPEGFLPFVRSVLAGLRGQALDALGASR